MTVAQQESVSMSTGVAIAAHFAEPAALAGGYDLAVIVPTYNEVDNVAGIIGSLDGALSRHPVRDRVRRRLVAGRHRRVYRGARGATARTSASSAASIGAGCRVR